MLRIAKDRDIKKKKTRSASDGGRHDRRRICVSRQLEQRSSNKATTRVACKARAEVDRPTHNCAEVAARGRRACGLRLTHSHARGQRSVRP